jgi:hypothetical protein
MVELKNKHDLVAPIAPPPEPRSLLEATVFGFCIGPQDQILRSIRARQNEFLNRTLADLLLESTGGPVEEAALFKFYNRLIKE